MMSTRLRKAQATLLFVGVAVFGIAPNASALTVSEVLSTPDDQVVSRGEFIRAVVKGLQIESIRPNGDNLPYLRVPAAMLPYVDAAHRRNALKPFGTDLLLAREITRGQAVQVLAALKGEVGSEAGITNFKDITPRTDEARAVSAAIEKNWMQPLRGDLFGVRRVLTGSEAKTMLRSALGLSTTTQPKLQVVPQRNDQNTSNNVQTIQVNYRPSTSSAVPKANILETIWRVINSEFLYDQNINPEEAAYRAIEGLVESLDEPYTTFFRPANNRNFQTQIDGQVTGIGAQVEHLNGVLTIVSPVRGSPAEAAGLLAGDEIVAADGESLAGLDFLSAVEKVRGPKGSTVLLRIRRNGSEFEVRVTRDVIKVPEVAISWQGDIAVIALAQFGKTTEQELRKHMADIQAQDPRGIVLDLRNNPGGLLTAAEKVVSNFVPKGTKVAEIHFKGSTQNDNTQDEPTIDANVPVVVLVNQGSASASEIVAGALQDHKRATIVGITTFGKGTVQEILQFEDDSSLKVTVAEWLTPTGRKINKAGIKPDVMVEDNGRDEQMLKALDILR